MYESVQDYIDDCAINSKLRGNLLIGFDFFEFDQTLIGKKTESTQEYKDFLEIKKHALAKAAQYCALTKGKSFDPRATLRYGTVAEECNMKQYEQSN